MSSREIHSKGGTTVKTGGLKEFHYPGRWRPSDEKDEVIRDIREYYEKHPERNLTFKNKTSQHKRVNYSESDFNHKNRPYKDSKPHTLPPNSWSKSLAILTLIILLVMVFLLIKIEKEETLEEENQEKVSYIEYVQFSFEDYLKNIDDYAGKEITISGYIYQTTEQRGTDNYFVEKIVDDFDNEIRLTKIDSAKGKNNIIENAFVNVTGVLKRRPSKVDLEVSEILPAIRPTRWVEREIEPLKPEEASNIKGLDNKENRTNIALTLYNLKDKVYILGARSKDYLSGKTKEISESIEEYEAEARLNEQEKMKKDSMDAFSYINQLRTENGRNKIEWSDDVYELALFRSRDMYNRKYFDHVTPEGKCAKDFKAEYGLSDYVLAENIGASMWEYSTDNVDYASYTNPREQVDGWIKSRGHRYNLLYSDHIMGAVACYQGVCAFLGAHAGPWGLGAGPCTTGQEGLAFWRTTSMAPGEI